MLTTGILPEQHTSEFHRYKPRFNTSKETTLNRQFSRKLYTPSFLWARSITLTSRGCTEKKSRCWTWWKISHRNKDTATLASDVLDQSKPNTAWELAKILAFRFVSRVNRRANHGEGIIKHSTLPDTSWISWIQAYSIPSFFALNPPHSLHRKEQLVFLPWYAVFCQVAPRIWTVPVKLLGKKRVEGLIKKG